MKSIIKIIKKSAVVCLTFILSIETFAAVVSDNDGSAFITKAEFDSLKNDFQSTLNQYNMNMDNKIDSAIASYLAGIKVEQEITLDSIIYKNSQYSAVEFSNTWNTPSTTLGDKCIVASMFWSMWNFSVYLPDYGYYTIYQTGWMNSTKNNSPTFVTDTKGTTQTQICQPGYNAQYNRYNMDNGTFWNVTPYAYAVAFRWHSALTNAWVQKSNRANVSMSLSGDTGTWSLSSGSNYGSVNKSFTVSFGGLNEAPTGEGMTGTYITGSKDEAINLSTHPGSKYIYRLAGNLVSGIIKTTKTEDWTKVDNSSCYTFNINNGSGFKLGDFWLGSWNGNDEVGLNSWQANLPKFNVYNKKNTDMYASSLIIDGYTNISGTPIYYYSGIPLFKATQKGIAEIELQFDVDITATGLSDGAEYSIKDTSFSNSNLLDNPTVKLYSDKDLKNEYNTLYFNDDTHIIKLYFKVEAGKTYWIKVKPYTENDVIVNTTSDSVKLIMGKLDS